MYTYIYIYIYISTYTSWSRSQLIQGSWGAQPFRGSHGQGGFKGIKKARLKLEEGTTPVLIRRYEIPPDQGQGTFGILFASSQTMFCLSVGTWRLNISIKHQSIRLYHRGMS